MKLAITTLLSVGLHVAVGWQWSVVGGIVAGFWAIRRGWIAGGVTVGLAWSILLAYSLFDAFNPVLRMFEVAGQLVGGLPAVFTPVAIVLCGFLLGLLAGFLGEALAGLREEPVVVEID
ncbi:MAG: hypothetical protein HKN43_13880 [Rhodothermales bacterium]|nr:hypothetical protein [Rhodothermales bacterium]